MAGHARGVCNVLLFIPVDYFSIIAGDRTSIQGISVVGVHALVRYSPGCFSANSAIWILPTLPGQQQALTDADI
jgi:hypothetical protein